MSSVRLMGEWQHTQLQQSQVGQKCKSALTGGIASPSCSSIQACTVPCILPSVSPLLLTLMPPSYRLVPNSGPYFPDSSHGAEGDT